MTATARPHARLARPRVAAPPSDAMRGPKWAAVGILVFFAGSILAVHLAYERAAAPALAMEAPAVAPVALAPAATRAQAVPLQAAAPSGTAMAAPPVDTSVPFRVGASASSAGSRDLNACVERIVGAAAAGEPKPSAPGRWPAVKRAREELRMKRLAARATCERELAL